VKSVVCPCVNGNVTTLPVLVSDQPAKSYPGSVGAVGADNVALVNTVVLATEDPPFELKVTFKGADWYLMTIIPEAPAEPVELPPPPLPPLPVFAVGFTSAEPPPPPPIEYVCELTLEVQPDDDFDSAEEHPPLLEKQKPFPPTLVGDEFGFPFVPVPRLPPIFLDSQLDPLNP
jgi:hypothetical protein